MAKTGAAAPAWSKTSRCNSSRPGRRTGSDSGGTTAPASPVFNQTRLLTLPGSIATTSVDAGNASCSKPTTASRPRQKRHRDAPAQTRSTAISCRCVGGQPLAKPLREAGVAGVVRATGVGRHDHPKQQLDDDAGAEQGQGDEPDPPEHGLHAAVLGQPAADTAQHLQKAGALAAGRV